jgi:hypothetical protein
VLRTGTLLRRSTGPHDSHTEKSPTVLASVSDQKVVNVDNWVDYIEPTLLEKFAAETGTAAEPQLDAIRGRWMMLSAPVADIALGHG